MTCKTLTFKQPPLRSKPSSADISSAMERRRVARTEQTVVRTGLKVVRMERLVVRMAPTQVRMVLINRVKVERV